MLVIKKRWGEPLNHRAFLAPGRLETLAKLSWRRSRYILQESRTATGRPETTHFLRSELASQALLLHRLTCSFPQSNCTRRRSGKKSCWRTAVVRMRLERARNSRVPTSDCSRLSSMADASGWQHQAFGAVARACRQRSQLQTRS